MPTLGDDIRASRERFVGWMRWYLAKHRDEVPNRATLAAKLGVSRSAITQLLRNGATRAPSFETIIGFRRLTGMDMDVLFRSDPPDKLKG